MSEPAVPLHEALRRKASPGRTLRAVGGAFFGVRKGADLERDAQELNPLYVVATGVVVALLFVLALVLLVQFIIRSGVAA